jgi:hypothetical protein
MKVLRALRETTRAMFLQHELLHVRFPINAEFEVEMWERPGLWCSDADLEMMVRDLRLVAAAGQKGKAVPMYGVLLGDRKDLETRVVTIVYATQETPRKPVGFNGLSYFDILIGNRVESVLHLGLTFIDPDYQRQGLPGLLYGVTAFLLLFKSGLRGFWISNVTQVPAVVGLVAENYADVYPHFNPGHRQTFTHLILARAIMRYHRAAFGVGDDAGFDETRQIITDAYTGGSDELKKTWEDAPKHRIEGVNKFCIDHLDYVRGDDVLQLGRCTLGSMLTFLRSRLPPGSPQKLIFQAIILLILSLVVPVVQWLFPPPENADPRQARHPKLH